MHNLANKTEIQLMYHDINSICSISYREPKPDIISGIADQILKLKLKKKDLVEFKKFWLNTGEKSFGWVNIRDWASRHRSKDDSKGPLDKLCHNNICNGDRVIEVAKENSSGTQIMWCCCFDGDPKGIMIAPSVNCIESMKSSLNKLGYKYLG